MNRLKSYFLLAAGMIIYGSATPISKLIADILPAIAASGFRVAMVAIILSPVLVKNRRLLTTLSKKDWLVLTGIAVIGVMLFSILMLLGMSMVSGVVGSIIMSTTPAVTAIGSILLFKDKVGWRKATGISLALAGVALINLQSGQYSGSGQGNMLIGSLLVFGAVLSEAAYSLLGKLATKDLSPLFITAITSLIATIAFIPFLIFQWPQIDITTLSVINWVELVWWGLGVMGLGTYLWYTGMKNVEGSTAAGFMGLMPISALALSYVLLGEKFQWIHLLGFGVVLLGVLLIAWSHAKMAKA